MGRKNAKKPHQSVSFCRGHVLLVTSDYLRQRNLYRLSINSSSNAESALRRLNANQPLPELAFEIVASALVRCPKSIEEKIISFLGNRLQARSAGKDWYKLRDVDVTIFKRFLMSHEIADVDAVAASKTCHDSSFVKQTEEEEEDKEEEEEEQDEEEQGDGEDGEQSKCYDRSPVVANNQSLDKDNNGNNDVADDNGDDTSDNDGHDNDDDTEKDVVTKYSDDATSSDEDFDRDDTSSDSRVIEENRFRKRRFVWKSFDDNSQATNGESSSPIDTKIMRRASLDSATTKPTTMDSVSMMDNPIVEK